MLENMKILFEKYELMENLIASFTCFSIVALSWLLSKLHPLLVKLLIFFIEKDERHNNSMLKGV